jgi:amino acid transporter
MPEWIIVTAVSIGMAIPFLWTALIVLAIKDLLFNRQEWPRPPVDGADDFPPEEVATMGRGCALALIFLLWPMMICASINDWLCKRSDQTSRSE